MSRVSTNFQELDIQEEECINLALADGYSKENMILVPRKGEYARKIGEIITVETPRGPYKSNYDMLLRKEEATQSLQMPGLELYRADCERLALLFAVQHTQIHQALRFI